MHDFDALAGVAAGLDAQQELIALSFGAQQTKVLLEGTRILGAKANLLDALNGAAGDTPFVLRVDLLSARDDHRAGACAGDRGDSR